MFNTGTESGNVSVTYVLSLFLGENFFPGMFKKCCVLRAINYFHWGFVVWWSISLILIPKIHHNAFFFFFFDINLQSRGKYRVKFSLDKFFVIVKKISSKVKKFVTNKIFSDTRHRKTIFLDTAKRIKKFYSKKFPTIDFSLYTDSRFLFCTKHCPSNLRIWARNLGSNELKNGESMYRLGWFFMLDL